LNVEDDMIHARRLPAALLFAGLMTMASTASGQEFISIDVPGAANGTYPFGVNGRGQVVGYYYIDPFTAHGFLRDTDGSLVTIDLPGATRGTLPAAINARGDIAGSFYDAVGGHAFIRTSGGDVTAFDVPGARHTFAWDLNAKGDVVGYWFDNVFTLHGFLRRADGSLSTIDAPGAYGTQLFGINADGFIVGRAYTESGAAAFVRSPDGSFSELSILGTPDVFAYAINNHGTIGGTYGWPSAGFIRDVYGNVSTIQAPGADRTILSRLNERGDAVGVRYPQPGVWIAQGFLMLGPQ
jgi:hypothetical protein